VKSLARLCRRIRKLSLYGRCACRNFAHGSDQQGCFLPGYLAVMITGMCLRFVFILITRVAAGLRLSRSEEMWKTAEILILRHQVAVLQRRQQGDQS
jgi:hypothetical protein